MAHPVLRCRGRWEHDLVVRQGVRQRRRYVAAALTGVVVGLVLLGGRRATPHAWLAPVEVLGDQVPDLLRDVAAAPDRVHHVDHGLAARPRHPTVPQLGQEQRVVEHPEVPLLRLGQHPFAVLGPGRQERVERLRVRVRAVHELEDWRGPRRVELLLYATHDARIGVDEADGPDGRPLTRAQRALGGLHGLVLGPAGFAGAEQRHEHEARPTADFEIAAEVVLDAGEGVQVGAFQVGRVGLGWCRGAVRRERVRDRQGVAPGADDRAAAGQDRVTELQVGLLAELLVQLGAHRGTADGQHDTAGVVIVRELLDDLPVDRVDQRVGVDRGRQQGAQVGLYRLQAYAVDGREPTRLGLRLRRGRGTGTGERAQDRRHLRHATAQAGGPARAGVGVQPGPVPRPVPG